MTNLLMKYFDIGLIAIGLLLVMLLRYPDIGAAMIASGLVFIIWKEVMGK